MKLGHDFGRTPFGFHQVLAHARRARAARKVEHAFGNLTAAACGEHDAQTRTQARAIRDELLEQARQA